MSKTNRTTTGLAELDKRYIWHPFTQMRDWVKSDPIIITRGHGAELEDSKGRTYLDANSSIWTNLHGHNHPRINAAIRRQLGRIAHSSSLGLANEPASILARELVRAANPDALLKPELGKVFFSDDGSTAIEAALKLAFEFTRRIERCRTPRFISLRGGYHGDTVGAVSLGHIDVFHKTYSRLLFRSDSVMAPYCYRCPYNRVKPERADAREYRKCRWECVSQVEKKMTRRASLREPYAGFVVEPLIQGAAGMIPQPEGWLRRVSEIARGNGSLIIADEVLTGFGRTGLEDSQPGRLFASHKEKVQPDFLALAKGMTGGYLPMAATLTSQSVFEAFLGEYQEFKSFFHGHSFTGNQLGSAAALASLDLLEKPQAQSQRKMLQRAIAEGLHGLWNIQTVGDIRQVGLIAGIELVRDWKTRERFNLSERAGIRVCHALARRGVLTRPVGDVLVVMPPYCTTQSQVSRIFEAVKDSIQEELGG